MGQALQMGNGNWLGEKHLRFMSVLVGTCVIWSDLMCIYVLVVTDCIKVNSAIFLQAWG